MIPGCSLDTEGKDIFWEFNIFFDVISFSVFIAGGTISLLGNFLNELFFEIIYLIINNF